MLPETQLQGLVQTLLFLEQMAERIAPFAIPIGYAAGLGIVILLVLMVARPRAS